MPPLKSLLHFSKLWALAVFCGYRTLGTEPPTPRCIQVCGELLLHWEKQAEALPPLPGRKRLVPSRKLDLNAALDMLPGAVL